jgi:hypothetical protein
MTHRTLTGLRAISLICLATSGGLALGQAVSLEALYSPDTGNITMQAFNADGTAGSLQIATFQFLSPPQFLNGSTAAIPASAVSFATVLNTDASTFFNPARTGAEIYATNFAGPTALFSSTWNLGNVASVGLSQSQIASGFTTDPDVSPGGQPLAGKFLYQIQGDPVFRAGAITAVPEPATLAFTGGVGLLGLAALRRFVSLRRWRTQPADHPGRGWA